MGAINGTLTIFLGGDAEACVMAEGIVSAYGRNVRRVGGSGAGQWMKLANQIAVGGALAGLCESLAFAHRAGLDIHLAKEMIGAGAGGSWAFDNYGPRILNENWEPGFSIRNQVKDFRYVISAAEQTGASVPTTRVINSQLESMLNEFGGETTAAWYRKLVDPS
jgi:3-hydroxyisobutyrate dehydrogenase-like beta-hydroxyacid dehydrogenase